MKYEEKTIESEVIYDGQILIFRSDKVMTPGGVSFREIVEHNGASGIIPMDSDFNIIMVNQYRKAIESMLLEIPAGKLEKGEDPLVGAKRELKEETGITADKFVHLTSILPAVGYSGEKLELYLATGLHYGETNLDDDEFIDIKKIHIDKLVEMIYEGKISDSKTLIAILMVKQMIEDGKL